MSGNYAQNPILTASSLDQIPEGSKIVTLEEAVNHKLNLVFNWKPSFDIWALRYGPHILGVCSVVPALAATAFIRRKLKLRTMHGYYSMYMASCFLPAGLSAILHWQFSSTYVILADANQCSLCIQSRSGLIQALVGSVYPVLITSMSGFMFAARHSTVDMPHPSEYKEMYQTWHKLIKKCVRPFIIVFFAQMLLGNIITYYEVKQYSLLQEKVLKNYLKTLEA